MAQQSYANHRKFAPLFHFVGLPLMGIVLVLASEPFREDPSRATALPALMAVFIAITFMLTRTFALGVQDRVIRLEERLRLERLLGDDLREPARALTTEQLIALRFASDEELPDLVRRVLAGELESQKAIKQAIGSWRPDHQRI